MSTSHQVGLTLVLDTEKWDKALGGLNAETLSDFLGRSISRSGRKSAELQAKIEEAIRDRKALIVLLSIDTHPIGKGETP